MKVYSYVAAFAIIVPSGFPARFLILRATRFAEIELWKLPGGRIKSGEEADDALKREILEELNVHAHLGPASVVRKEPRCGGKNTGVEYWPIRVDAMFTPRLSEEHDSFRWITADESCDYSIDTKLDKLAFSSIVRALIELALGGLGGTIDFST